MLGDSLVHEELYTCPVGNTAYPMIWGDDYRAPMTELAITLFYPLMLYNHTVDAVFQPNGSLIVSKKPAHEILPKYCFDVSGGFPGSAQLGCKIAMEQTFGDAPLQFAFPWDQKTVSEDMLQQAYQFIKSGQAQGLVNQAGPNTAGSIAKWIGTGTAAATALGIGAGAGSVVPGLGTAIGAAVGGLVGLFSSMFGDQEYDLPEGLKAYSAKNQQLRTASGLDYRYDVWSYNPFNENQVWSNCMSVSFDAPRGQYTIYEAGVKLFQMLGKDLPVAPGVPNVAPGSLRYMGPTDADLGIQPWYLQTKWQIAVGGFAMILVGAALAKRKKRRAASAPKAAPASA